MQPEKPPQVCTSPSCEVLYPQIMTKIQFEVSPKPFKEKQQQEGKSGFVPVATRWIIERSNA